MLCLVCRVWCALSPRHSRRLVDSRQSQTSWSDGAVRKQASAWPEYCWRGLVRLAARSAKPTVQLLAVNTRLERSIRCRVDALPTALLYFVCIRRLRRLRVFSKRLSGPSPLRSILDVRQASPSSGGAGRFVSPGDWTASFIPQTRRRSAAGVSAVQFGPEDS